jgi:hypothetical protein
VSTSDTPESRRAASFLANLVGDAEVERLQRLDDEELRAKMSREGRDPSRVPSAEALLARVKARAEREGHVRVDARTAKAANAVPAEPAAHAASAGAYDPRVDRPAARAVPLRRSGRILALLAAAFVVLLGIVAVAKRQELVALFHDDATIEPDRDQAPGPSRHERAERLRHDAFGNCEFGDWSTCAKLLDRAAELDPAGESEDAVKTMRGKIENPEKAPRSRPPIQPIQPDKPPRR